jgi:glycosyltransferase involved in cell wall biosynthesis
MEYPKFSVLMSVYIKTDAKQLKESLDSVIYQTILPSEVIIVFDGQVSQDVKQCIDRIKKMTTIPFQILRLDHNQGLGEALRQGTSLVASNWIARVDSDDINDLKRFEKQLSYIVLHPELKLLGTQLKEFSGDISNITGRRIVPCDYEAIIRFARYRSPFNHPTIFIEKNALESVGGYQPFLGMEDYHLWGRILTAKYEVANLSESLLYMRADDGIYSRRGGFIYLKNYIKLRKLHQQWGLITPTQRLKSEIIIAINSIIPGFLRKILYNNLIHKR